jgi:hypothetical protein
MRQLQRVRIRLLVKGKLSKFTDGNAGNIRPQRAPRLKDSALGLHQDIYVSF